MHFCGKTKINHMYQILRNKIYCVGASIWSISILSSTFFGGEMQFLWQDQNKSHVPNFTKRYCVGASFWSISILSSTFFGVDTSEGVSSFSDPSQLSNNTYFHPSQVYA